MLCPTGQGNAASQQDGPEGRQKWIKSRVAVQWRQEIGVVTFDYFDANAGSSEASDAGSAGLLAASAGPLAASAGWLRLSLGPVG